MLLNRNWETSDAGGSDPVAQSQDVSDRQSSVVSEKEQCGNLWENRVLQSSEPSEHHMGKGTKFVW